MQTRFQLSTLAVVSTLLLLPALGAGQENPVYVAPQFTVTDQDGVVVGALASVGSRISSPSENFVRVLRQDTGSNENYTFLVGADHLQGIDDEDLWYSNADCTGTAYVLAPSNSGFAGDLVELRGSVFVIGRNPVVAAAIEDSLVLRGSGSGTDNSGDMLSRYRTDLVNGPSCNTPDSTTSDTVEATLVDDLSGLLRPFKID